MFVDEAKSQSKPATVATAASRFGAKNTFPRRPQRRRWRQCGSIYLEANPNDNTLLRYATIANSRPTVPSRRRLELHGTPATT